ncbi:MAG TPA: undecaprenyl-phosphate glucose phosphotransferase, partial [Burkholderiaceae bacterium]
MFEDRTYKRTFYSAPQSVTSLVAAFLEPSITVLTFLFITLYADEPVDRPALTLCLLVFALTFPGRNHFRDNLIAAGVDILSSWITLAAILALCGYATRSLHFFDNAILLNWLIATPVLQWLAVWIGKVVVKRLSARPSARRAA